MFVIQRVAEEPVIDIHDEVGDDSCHAVSDATYGLPLIDYLTAIDADFWWSFGPRTALAFGTRDEAEKVVAAYRRNDGDHRSFIRILADEGAGGPG